MQERVRELAGALEFGSDGAGMLVKAVIPFAATPRSVEPPPPRERAQGAG